MKGGHVYIIADRYRGTIYIGVTAQLAARIYQHRTGDGSDFCKRYALDRLVYAESHANISDAIVREKAMKKWNRGWKLRLIEEQNPEWLDLFDALNA
ncbi:putative endonuclease [Sphingopyxis panaciterrae]|uniref:GIY-YIG nuclease family protein n=1 Tax=Sphingopyxis panaciterrae TaxID=363841 RepID=UPI00141D9AC9|nr:putative endonuclease [Sphingopyxis panaciterrae]